MRDKKTVRDKLIAIFLAAAVAVTMIPAGIAVSIEPVHAATAYSYTLSRPSVTINGHKVKLSIFTISSLGIRGTCCKACTTAKKGKATVSRLDNNDLRVKLMYYYGYQLGYLGQANMNGFLLGRALSWAGGRKPTWPCTEKQVKNYINAMPGNVVVPDRFECYYCNPTNGTQDFMAYKMNPPGYITLYKTSADARSMAAGSGYSFEGIEYTVYNAGGAAVGVLACRANGTTNTLTLDTGTYSVRETKTNQWYKMSGQVFTQYVGAGQTWSISAADSPETGTVQIKKEVAGNYDGDLAFEFRLTNTANPAINYNVKTDAKTGEASAQVVQGTYRCEELLSEDSPVMDMTGPQTGTVKIGETYTFKRENRSIKSGVLQIRKATNDGSPADGFRFKVSGELYNQGQLTESALLEAADASVSGYDEEVYEPAEWTVSKEDLEELNKAAADRETGKKTVHLSGGLKYKGETGTSIEEIVKSLSNEEAEGKIAEGTRIASDGKAYVAKKETAFAVTFKDGEAHEIDADKTADTIRELLEGESFEEADADSIDISAEITINLKPVEYVYDSEEPEEAAYEKDPARQIKNKKEDTKDKGDYKITCSDFDWYGAATVYQEIKNGELTGKTESFVETEDGGSSPALEEGITFGKFTVEEVMTDSQKKQYRQPKPQTREITEKDRIAAFIFSFENEAKWTDVELVKTSADGNVSGITFRLEGKDSRGENVDVEAVTDKDGKISFGKLYAGEYVVSEKDFDPDKYENNNRLEGYDVPAQKLLVTGEEEEKITVSFDNVPLKSLYLTKVDKDTQLFLKNAVFSLLEGDEELALFRIVLDDYGRVGIDMIKCDEESGIRAGVSKTVSSAADAKASEDEDNDEEPDVEYHYAEIRGLKEGKTYTLKEVKAPAGYAASVNKIFVFEDGQKLILENTAPQISTLAVDKATNIHMSDAEGNVTIVDTVSYSNLAPGHKYIMNGALACRPDGERTVEQLEHDTEAIEVVKDAKGKEVTAQKAFTPESGSGTVKIEFTFDASLLDGKQTVVMEQLLDPELEGINESATVIASHEELEDEAQSIYFPELRTTASADDTGKHITAADGDVTITDVVKYSNVIAGKVYVLTGTLMDKDTGKPVLSNGAKVTSSVTFRAEKDGPVFAGEGETLSDRDDDADTDTDTVELVSGEAEMKFHFDGSALAGKKTVAFEKLTTGGVLVGEHSDINDEEQAVYLPGIETTASTNGTDNVKDKVMYTNLPAGMQYLMSGVLMDKATGEELVLDGETVTAQTYFVPEKKDGSMIMDFPVDVKQLEGKTVVAFEACSLVMDDGTEIEIISHRDINNKAQTVAFDVPQTGQTGPWKFLIPVLLLTLAAIGVMLRRIRRT